MSYLLKEYLEEEIQRELLNAPSKQSARYDWEDDYRWIMNKRKRPIPQNLEDIIYYLCKITFYNEEFDIKNIKNIKNVREWEVAAFHEEDNWQDAERCNESWENMKEHYRIYRLI